MTSSLRSVPGWLAGVIQELELDRSTLVTVDDIQRARPDWIGPWRAAPSPTSSDAAGSAQSACVEPRSSFPGPQRGRIHPAIPG